MRDGGSHSLSMMGKSLRRRPAGSPVPPSRLSKSVHSLSTHAGVRTRRVWRLRSTARSMFTSDGVPISKFAGVDADPQPSAFQPRQELLPDPVGILVAVADEDIVAVVRLWRHRGILSSRVLVLPDLTGL